MRDTYVDSVGITNTSGAFAPLASIEVNVYLAGTTSPATIYTGRTGSTQKSNPFVTTTGGVVEFWAEYGDYDIKFHDQAVPVRMSDKTIGFNSTSGANGGIPSAKLAADGTIPFGSIDPVLMRQLAPVGTVIDWWRPASSVGLPTGWAVCDGSSVLVANHDFGTGGTITLPDLRNVFVLGADKDKTDAVTATLNSNATTSGPGIRGTGGAHSRQLSVPGHSHGLGSLANSTIGNHSHGGATGGAGTHNHGATGGSFVTTGFSGSSAQIAITPPGAFIVNNTGTTSVGDHGHAIGGDGGHTHTLSGSVGSGASGDGTFNTVAQETRPLYVGLLKLMKVKRS